MGKLTKLGARRLLKLAKILDKADARYTAAGDSKYDQELYVHSCGAPACALGHWGAANPLRFRLRPGGVVGEIVYRRTQAHLDYESAAEEFGISEIDAYRMFGPEGCGEAKIAAAAAEYIRTFVKRKGVA